MTIASDLIAALKAYADATSDSDFIAAFGATGSKIQIDNVSEDTGQVWLNTPNMPTALLTAIAEVLGTWRTDDVVAVATSSIALTAVPVAAEVLEVYHLGVLLRQVSAPSAITEYSWATGSTTITFGGALTGWVHARYLAARA